MSNDNKVLTSVSIENGCVAIPPAFRDILGDVMVVIPRMQGGKVLQFMSMKVFVEKMACAQKTVDAETALEMLTVLGENSERVACDAEGRVTISPRLSEFAGLQSAGVFVLENDRILLKGLTNVKRSEA